MVLQTKVCLKDRFISKLHLEVLLRITILRLKLGTKLKISDNRQDLF